jgi:hypothetical protein
MEATPDIVGNIGDVVFSFRITRPDGQPLVSFDELHERRMHLIVVRRDLVGFQHVHPRMEPDGTWRATVNFPSAGAWRAFADFSTGGVPTTLGTDIGVSGEFRPEPLPAPSRSAEVDGDTVSFEQAADRTVRFTVSRGGVPLDVEPYLGARGHLVVLRWGDLAFLHVHPIDDEGIVFRVGYDAPGRYRLFLQYSVDGRVRTAAFTVDVDAADEGSGPG